MIYLLDTHTFLFWVFNDSRLSKTAHRIIQNPENNILVSSATAWEIATKYRIGKLESARVLVQDLPGWVARAGFQELSISIAHAQKAGSWPQPHRDAFDRMLAAQSELEGYPIISRDKALATFGIQLIW